MNVKSIIRQIYDLGIADEAFHSLGVAPRIGVIGRFAAGVGILTAGVLIGAGAGLLLAPMTGRELRERAKERVDDVRERVKERGDRIRSQVDDARRRERAPF